MHVHSTSLAVLAGLAGLIATAAFVPAARSRGPGLLDPVRELHQKLFDALDHGDRVAASALFAHDPVLYVVDRNGKPVALWGAFAVANLVSLWTSGIEGPDATVASSTSILTEGPSGCVVLFEIERPTREVRYLRGTSVVQLRNDEDGNRTFEIRHLHLSPAGREDF